MTRYILSWLCGIVLFAAGIVNVLWGNDPGLGVGLLLLSFLYTPPTSTRINTFLKEKTGFSLSSTVKIILFILLVWVILGVGELANKLSLMKMDL